MNQLQPKSRSLACALSDVVNRCTLATMASAACLALASAAGGQTPVLPANAMTTYSYYDSVNGGSAVPLAVTGQPFTRSVRVTTTGSGTNVYNAQLGWNTIAAVNQGDLLMLTFWARRLAPLDGRPIEAQVVFERNSGDYLHSLTCSFPNDTSTWQQYSVPFRAVTSHPAAGAHLSFQFSIGPQSFEIGGVSVMNYGPNVQPGTLTTAFYYPGREATAPWRAQAEARINQHRKGAMNVRVVNCLGEPVSGANVHLVLSRHAFGFGTALAADVLMGTGANNDLYRSTFLANFSSAVIENHLKWPVWESWGQTTALAAVDWLNARGIPTRGHNIIWPSWQYVPADCATLPATALRSRISAHIQQILGATRGKLVEWDVINEPYANYDVMGRIAGVPGVPQSSGVLGTTEMVRWFQQARAADANIGLALNDYDVWEGVDPNHRAYTTALVRWLLDNGAPVTRLGLQAHIGNAFLPISELERRLDTLLALPVRLSVTEFDIDTLDEQLQADYTRDFLTLVFSQPRFDEFLMWGFWENAHWLPNGAMFRANWSAKPNAVVWRDLIYNRWHTDVTATSNGQGMLTADAFYGQYRVDVTGPGVQASQSTVSFTTAGQTVTVVAGAGLVSQPQDAVVCAAGRADFQVPAATAGSTTSYQWQGRSGGDGTWMSLASGVTAGLGTVYGTTTGNLVVTNVAASPVLDQFRCVITVSGTNCGVLTSDAARLTIARPCSVADVAGTGGATASCGDGVVDGSDFIAFINSFSVGDVAADSLADVAGAGPDGLSPDGIIDGSDFVAFINAFGEGC